MAVATMPGEVEKAQLGTLCKAITRYAAQHVDVTGSTRLLKRAQRDLASVTALVAQNQHLAREAGQSTEIFSKAMEIQLQGARNNIRGMQAELDVAEQAPGVLCLGARFYSEVTSGTLAQAFGHC